MTKRMNIPFSPPDMTEREVEAVGEVLRSGWITTGPKTKELERRMAEFTHTKRGACLNSATACMETALRLFDIGPGDEVIVPAYTYTASASVVCHVGATLKLIDVEKGTYHLDYDALEHAITDKTKAVIPVDIAGVMVDYDRIRSILESKKHLFKPASLYQEALGRVLILADSAHGYGASRGGLMSGECADFTSFSFHAVKNFTTGEGGGLVWRELPGVDDEEIYKNIMLMSLHGQSKDALAKTKLGAWEYDIVAPLYKCNMTDIVASIGLVQMDRYPGLLARRRQIIGMYNEGIQAPRTASNVVNNTKQNSALLKKLGIMVDSKNKLSIDETTFKNADMAVAKSVFASTASYGQSVASSASSIYSSSAAQLSKLQTQNLYNSSGSYNYYSAGSLYNQFT